MRGLFFASSFFFGAFFFGCLIVVFSPMAVPTAFALSSCESIPGQACMSPDCRGGTNLMPGFACPSGSGVCCGPGPGSLPGSGVTDTGGCPAGFQKQSGVCFPASGSTGLGDMSVYDLLQRVMNWLLGIVGVLAVIAFVISGVQYLVSAGNEDLAETAKRNMKYAIIGLVVALSGLIILNAIAGLTGAGGVISY